MVLAKRGTMTFISSILVKPLFPSQYNHPPSLLFLFFFLFLPIIHHIFISCFQIYTILLLILYTATKTWTKVSAKGSVPPQRTSHTAVVWKDKMYTFGGFSGEHYLNDLHEFDLGIYISISIIHYIQSIQSTS